MADDKNTMSRDSAIDNANTRAEYEKLLARVPSVVVDMVRANNAADKDTDIAIFVYSRYYGMKVSSVHTTDLSFTNKLRDYGKFL